MSDWTVTKIQLHHSKRHRRAQEGCEPFSVTLTAGTGKNRASSASSTEADYGGWPSTVLVKDAGKEAVFGPKAHICPFMADGEVLVLMEVGAEKMCT